MSNQVVHFEIEGLDSEALRTFYAEVFGWEFDVDTSNPADYGMIRGTVGTDNFRGAVSKVPSEPSSTWRGPTRAQGYAGHVTVFVQVEDVERTMNQVEQLGGRRMQGPDPMMPGVEFAKFADPEGHLIGIVGPAR